MHTKTIVFLGTFFGSSDPTSDQDHTMSFFDEPEDDPFAELNEEEHRLGLVGQQVEEQKPDWEQVLESGSCSSELCRGFVGCGAQSQCSKGVQHDLATKFMCMQMELSCCM